MAQRTDGETRAPADPRPPYRPPRLVVYGDLRQLTRGSNNPNQMNDMNNGPFKT